MKNLFKISFCLILAIFAGSCSKEESPKVEEIVKETIITPVPENILSFKISAEDGRVGGNGNYQAGETIRFKVAITDSQQDLGAEYIITPEGQNRQKHQIIEEDYKLLNNVNGVMIPASKIAFSYAERQNGIFSITILRPGTFTLKFNMQKKNNGLNVGLPTSENLAFAAVAFSAYSEYGYQDIRGHKNCYGTVENRRYDRNFYFSVNCGDQATDKYLFDSNFTYTYESSYCAGSSGASGGLSDGNKNKFCRSYAAGAGDCSIGRLEIINCNGHNGFIIDEIKIFIKPVNGNVFNTISYKNVPITNEFNVL